MRQAIKHQSRSIAAFWEMHKNGKRKICLTMPCGSGKTFTAMQIVKEAIRRGMRVCMMAHRKLLISQLSREFTIENIPHGIRASGYDEDRDQFVQISSRDTEVARCLNRKSWSLPRADLLIIDERHVNKNGAIIRIEDEMRAMAPDMCTLSLTATPVDIWNACEDLIIGATNSELRQTTPPLHYPCTVYSPDELDMSKLKRNKTGEFSEQDNPWADSKAAPTIFGRVFPHWREHNPEMRPTILFAPSVMSSMFFVDLFRANGVPAAHIDGECLYFGEKNPDGSNRVDYTTESKQRERVFDFLKSGKIKVLCNRFVLTEAIDLPWAYHEILAASYGSIATYLQIVGRIQRAHSSLPGRCLITDHGGNVRRFGHPDMDRYWQVGDSWADFVSKKNDKGEETNSRLKDKENKEILCQCGQYRTGGATCPSCGRQAGKERIVVLQLDGSLKEVPLTHSNKKIGSTKPEIQRSFDKLFFSSKNSKAGAGKTYNQLISDLKFHDPGNKHHIHVNVDSNGNKRWCYINNGMIVPIKGLPKADDRYLMSQRIKSVAQKQVAQILSLPEK